ncbi:cation channel family protein (macronuclear) [Tetrahymena thermophila SB210]|uniref:Cation channel family protein n=1 Tax=Tetrahymena thermophila (strain SB210) TaxID=312017 RepID=Q23K98_TETTS|nr:cation channel family protein [Tetrahymena thermophila SB210]EAR96945.2 cation channel family protein [Tetrahymena thermophila SB210]|eukprot:XP_001017190.2 cation channel family protein [Tetrahymena thermophila SB210]
MSQVKFGDYITIQGTLLDKNNTNGAHYGYMCTTGFTNNEIYLEKQSKSIFANTSNQDQQISQKPEDNVFSIKNYREYVFQIWPKLDYDAHKKYSKLLEEKNQIQKKLKSSKDNIDISEEDQERMKEYLNEVREKIKIAKIAKESEKANNLKQLESVKGNFVCYGQEIFLMHADSQSFLNGLLQASVSEKSAFMLQVTKFFQRGMVFKFQPKYKLRKEGEIIQYKDQISIFNVKQQCWANFVPSNITQQDKIIQGPTPTNYYQSIDFQKYQNRQRVEVFLTKVKEAFWQIHIHSDYIQNQETSIKGGDLIYLYHTELQGALTADISYDNKKGYSEAYIRKYQGEYELEKYSVASIWEIEKDSCFDRGSNIPVSSLSNQDKKSTQSFKIRHFLTGKVLSIQQVNQGQYIPCLAKDDLTTLENSSKIQFVSTQNDENEIMEDNHCYLIKINDQFIQANSSIQYTVQKHEKNSENKLNVTDFKDVTENMIYKPIDDSEFEVYRNGLTCVDKGSTEENAFQVIKLTEEEKQNILYVNSSLNILHKFLQKLRNVPYREPLPKKEYIKKVGQILSDLVLFVVKTESKNPLECEGIPIPKRQKIMKDYKFIELLVDLLYYPFKTEVYKMKELDQIDPDTVKIFKLCNVLINNSIKEYRPNEIYASQWINLLIFQSEMTEGYCDIGSEETLTELIDNNKKILETIDEVTVNKFLQMLMENQNKKYVKLIRALILCNGQPVHNQELISNYLLSGMDAISNDEDETGQVSQNKVSQVLQRQVDINKPLIIQAVKYINGEVWVQSPFKENYGKFMLLSKFQEMSTESQENLDKFEYFSEMIGMLSDLCKSRNYTAINQLVHVYKRRVCFEIVQNSLFDPYLRRSFVMLIHTMYLDISDFKKFSLPNNIRVWTEIEKAKSIVSVYDQQQNLEKVMGLNSFVSPLLYASNHLKVFSIEYIIGIAKSKYMSSLKEPENLLTYSILQMIQDLVDFGFFDNSDELESLVKNIIKILDSSLDVGNQNEEEAAEEVVKLLSCRTTISKGNIPQALKKLNHIQISRFTGRYEHTEDNLIVHECKTICCEILKKVILIRNDMRITQFMKKFKNEFDLITTFKPMNKNSKKKPSMKPLEIENPIQQFQRKRNPSDTPNSVNQSHIQGDKSPLINEVFSNQLKIEEGIQDVSEQERRQISQALAKRSQEMLDEIFFQNTIKLRGCLKVDVVAIFQDLTLYQNSDLVNNSFEILNMLFTERQEILNLLQNLQLLEDHEQIQSYFSMKQIQDNLSEQVEKSENWLFKYEEANIKEAVKVEINLQQIVQIQAQKLQGLPLPVIGIEQGEDTGRLLNQKQDYNQGIRQEAINFIEQLFEEDEVKNQYSQELIRNSYLYQQIIDLLNYDANTFTRKRQEEGINKLNFNDTSVFIRILRLCYKILGRLVIGNKQNQILLTDQVTDFIFKHMKYLPQSYPHLLLDPLIEQNSLLIMHEEICRKFVKEIFNCINILKSHNILNLVSCYLDILKKIPYVNDIIVKENQTIIMDLLTSKENQNLLSFINFDDPSYKQLIHSSQQFQNFVDSGQEEIIDVPQELDYFDSLLSLMAAVCDSKNNATESKAQSYISLYQLKELLIKFKNCFYVKRSLYFFFFHVYLDTEKEMSDQLLEIKKFIIQSIEDDLILITNNLDVQDIQLLNYKGKISLQKIKLEYIFESLFLCVDTILCKKLLDTSSEKQFLTQLLESIIKVSQLSVLKQTHKRKLKGILIQLVVRGFTSIQKLKQHNINSQIIPNLLEVRQTQKNLQDYFSTTIQISHESTVQLSQKQATLLDVIKKLKKSEILQEEIRKEFKNFVDYFTDIKYISLKAFQGLCTIEFSELTTAMIKLMVQNRFVNDYDNTQNELEKKRLQVLRQIIELENPESNDSIDLWDSLEGFEEEIIKRQNQLIQQGVAEMIVEIIKDPQASSDIKEEAILLGIALLIGGNAKTQDEFLKALSSDSNNQFLGVLYDMITRGLLLIKKNMSKLNKQVEFKLIEEQKQALDQQINLNDEDFDDKLSDDEAADVMDSQDDDEESQIPQNVIQEIRRIRRVYRLLQLFCEGHNNQFQNHLRQQIIDQQESGKSIDFIMNTTILFSSAVKYLNIHCIDLIDQILDFLIESIQGPCVENQITMCRGKINETCKDLLQKFQGNQEQNKQYYILGFDTEENKEELESLISKSFKLLYSLIEGDPSKDILQQMCQTLDFNHLFQILDDKFKKILQQLNISFVQTLNFSDEKIRKIVDRLDSHFDESLEGVFDIYLLISTLSDKDENVKQLLENPPDEYVSALKFFKYNTASIEVVFKNNLIRVYFPIQPICRLLSKNSRATLMEEIPRSTTSEKIEGLVEATIDLFDEMEHLAFLKKQIFNFSSNRLQALMLISYTFALAINLTILFTYKLTFEEFQKAKNYINPGALTTTVVFGIIQFITVLIIILFYIIIHGPLIIKRSWHAIQEENEKFKKPQEEERIIEAKYLSLRDAVSVLMTKGPNAEEFWKSGKRDFGHFFVAFFYYWRNFQTMMRQGSFIYLLFYVIVSAMGLFVSDITYCLLLLDIIARFPTLQNVVKAVTTNIRQIGLTTLLGAVLIYIYSIFAFYFSDQTYKTTEVYGLDGEKGDQNTCTTLFQCYLYTLNQGLLHAAGIGEAIAKPSYEDPSTFIFRYFFDLSFFMIINIMFLNFIFGIIIDTFAQLRDEKQKKEEDKNNVCFICGLSRNEFDKVPGGFTIHIEKQHQLWYYVYYIYHLKCKDSTEYNGVESYIQDLLNKQQTTWFPLLKALSLSKSEDQNQESQIENKFEKLKSGLKDVTSKVEKISSKKIEKKKNK